jgi:hypothetical protein
MKPMLMAARDIAHWWWGELRGIGLDLIRHLPSRQSPQLFVRAGRETLSIESREGSAWRVVAKVPRASEGNGNNEPPVIPSGYSGSRTAIVLAESDLFFCDFDLPAAAERELDPVLRLQLERALPIPLEQILFDRQVVTRDRHRLAVRIAVAHRQPVEELRDRIAGWGLKPVCAGPVNEEGTPAFNLLKRKRHSLRWRPSRHDRWLLRAATALVAALALAIGALWIRERALVDAGAAELHAQAARLTIERESVIREARPLLGLQAIARTADVPAMFSALSSSMPSGNWFSHIEIAAGIDEPGRLRLIGAVAAREEALAALRGVPGIRNLEVTSAYSGELGAGESVEISAEFEAARPKAAGL